MVVEERNFQEGIESILGWEFEEREAWRPSGGALPFAKDTKGRAPSST
jgi:hypothetical protein